MGKNVIVIGADVSSFVHIDNTYKDIFRKYNQKGEIQPTLNDLLMMSMKVVILLF